MRATKYLYLTSSDNGEPQGTFTSPLVILESHQVPLPLLKWYCRATKYLYLNSSDTGEPLGTSKVAGEPPSISTSLLVTLESHQVPLPNL